MHVVTLQKIIYFVQKGFLDSSKPITVKDLFEAGAVSKVTYGLKLLARGAHGLKDLTEPLHIEVNDAS